MKDSEKKEMCERKGDRETAKKRDKKRERERWKTECQDKSLTEKRKG